MEIRRVAQGGCGTGMKYDAGEARGIPILSRLLTARASRYLGQRRMKGPTSVHSPKMPTLTNLKSQIHFPISNPLSSERQS